MAAPAGSSGGVPTSPAEDLNFVTVPGVTVSGLSRSGKVKVTINNQEIVLLSHRGQIYAIQSKCPHKGGPLEQGEIEESPKSGACIRCPWHAYTFNLISGTCVAPGTSFDKKMHVYPVRLNKDEIKVGFEKARGS